MLQNVRSYCHQSIFFAIHLAFLIDECETVDVWVDDDTEIGASFFDLSTCLYQMSCERFWIMSEVTGHFTVEFNNIIDAQLSE